jgi:septum formation protein
MNTPALILASASPRRADLLRRLGLEFHVVPSEVAEEEGGVLSADEVAQINAYLKARAVARLHPDAVTLGVDTVVVLGTQLFGKPATMAQAEQMLMALQGRTHQVITGVCLIHLSSHRRKVFSEQTDVRFRALTLQQIRHYLRHTNPLDKAGGYGIQDQGDVLVEAISGSFTNVMGLPMERFQAEWAAFGESVVAV